MRFQKIKTYRLIRKWKFFFVQLEIWRPRCTKVDLMAPTMATFKYSIVSIIIRKYIDTKATIDLGDFNSQTLDHTNGKVLNKQEF